MKLIKRTDLTKHMIGINPWPRWCFHLWAMGCSDRIATQDYSDDFTNIPRWQFTMWRVRGPLLESIFGRLWWWV